MSIAFSHFNRAGIVANPDQDIALGLGWGPGGLGGGGVVAVNVVTNAAPVIPNTAIPPAITNQLAYIAARWRRRTEADKRAQIDAFVQAIMEPMAPPVGIVFPVVAPGVINAGLRVAAEQTIAVAGVAGAVALGGQVGHGKLDYLMSRRMPVGGGGPRLNRLRPSVIVEAKASLGAGGAFGQWQMCAELATAKQLAGGTRRRTRGVLTDGRRWRFYELDAGVALGQPILSRTNVFNAAILAQRNQVIQLLQRFITNYNTAAALL